MKIKPTLALICVLAFIAAAAVAYGVFQAVPHLEDEQANLFQARVFAQGKLYAASPSQPGAFFVAFVLDWNGHRFSKYPPGYSAVLALGVLAGQPWLVNPLLGALGLAALYALGRAIYPEPQGASVSLLAAMLGVLSPMFLGLSSALLAHALSLLLLTVFAWAFIRTIQTSVFQESCNCRGDRYARSANLCLAPARSNLLYAAIAGLALGGAAITRQLTALALAVPFAVWGTWRILRRQISPWPFVVMALIAGALAALVPLYQWALTGNPWANLYAAWWGYDVVGFGPNHGSDPAGHNLGNALLNAYLDTLSLLTDLLGWPWLSWALIAPGLFMLPRDRRDAALLAPLAAIVVAYGFYWVRGSPIYGPRYWYEAAPFLWLLSARGLYKLWEWTQDRLALRRLLQASLAALVAMNVVMTIPARFGFWRGLYFVTDAPYKAVRASGIHHALVIVRGQLWTDYGAVSWANSLDLQGDVVFARDQGLEVNQQVVAEYPGRQVYWLDGTRLSPYRR